MIEEIIVKKKPDNISFDEIHEVIYAAHKENMKNGILMRTTTLTGEELKDRIGDDGICFVALDKQKVVGTMSVRFVKRKTWYANSIIPDCILVGVIPEYRGKHITSMLEQIMLEYVKNKGYKLIELDTAENNTHAINVYKHQGYKLVDYHAYEGVDHYSVVMVKWIEKCPYSETYRKIRYYVRRFLIKSRYKVGKVKRFGI